MEACNKEHNLDVVYQHTQINVEEATLLLSFYKTDNNKYCDQEYEEDSEYDPPSIWALGALIFSTSCKARLAVCT